MGAFNGGILSQIGSIMEALMGIPYLMSGIMRDYLSDESHNRDP